MSLRLWLIRHGQSTWNVEKKAQGWADPPLSDLGVWQAKKTAQHLSQETEFEALYSSNLVRASKTAQALADITGLPIQTDERLREHGLGEAQGMVWDFSQAVKRWPQIAEPAARGELIFSLIPGAEALDAFMERIVTAFDEIRARHSSGNIAVVSHGGVFRAYFAHLMRSPIGFPGLRFDNASYSLVKLRDPGWVSIEYINQFCHVRDVPAALLGDA